MKTRRGHLYATQLEAQQNVEAIDIARGPTEVITLPDGTEETVPRLTWAIPEQLSDGQWFLSWKDEDLAGIAGEVVTLPSGVVITIPSDSTAVDVPVSAWPDGQE